MSCCDWWNLLFAKCESGLSFCGSPALLLPLKAANSCAALYGLFSYCPWVLMDHFIQTVTLQLHRFSASFYFKTQWRQSSRYGTLLTFNFLWHKSLYCFPVCGKCNHSKKFSFSPSSEWDWSGPHRPVWDGATVSDFHRFQIYLQSATKWSAW